MDNNLNSNNTSTEDIIPPHTEYKRGGSLQLNHIRSAADNAGSQPFQSVPSVQLNQIQSQQTPSVQ
ncbi:MAG: hypothetical protein MJ095_07360, partial [Oscillospiraceae bacterium]|nr:hypothetical protein [Oscillospiraceae bacterium]